MFHIPNKNSSVMPNDKEDDMMKGLKPDEEGQQEDGLTPETGTGTNMGAKQSNLPLM